MFRKPMLLLDPTFRTPWTRLLPKLEVMHIGSCGFGSQRWSS